MGQLTNLYVSSSYQGLLKMTDSTNGLTNTLQTVQTGDGDNSPLQMSLTEVNISGSLTVNGQPISVDTGSLVTTASFNAYTSSVDTKLAGLDIETGSLQNQIDGLATTSSLTSLSSSIAVTDLNQNNVIAGLATTSSLTSLSSSIATTDLSQNNRLTSIEGITGSLATTSSLTSLSSSIATTDLGQDNRLGSLESKTGSYATTGSNIFNGNQTITGSVNITGNISATSASFTYVNTIYETASVIYSSGSNQFGDASNDTQTLWGRVAIPTGPVSVTGSVIATNFTGSLQGTASFATSASFAQNVVSSSFAQIAQNAITLAGISASLYARRNQTNTFTADQTINSGSVLIAYEINSDTGEPLIIASDGPVGGSGKRILFVDKPSSGGQPYGDTSVFVSGSLQTSGGITGSLLGNASSATNATNFANRNIAQFALTGSNSFNGNQTITGSVTASAGFVGNLTGTASYATNALSASWAPDTTNTSSLVTSVVGGAVSFEDQIIVTKGDGTTNTITVNNVTNADSASFATNAATASFATNVVSSSFAATSSIAYDLVVNGKCDNPGGLTRGTIVRITGANGDNPLFNSASWTDDLNSANTLGMLSEDAAYNSFANVVVQGRVIGINTNGMTAGDLLFLSSSGQYTTSSVPAPYHEVRLGQVLRANTNNGSAYVTIDNGYELSELHDVDITSPVDGDLLVYRSGSYGQWVNETGGELGFATTGSNIFKGSQVISGSLITNVLNDGIISINSELYESGSVKASITSSAAIGQSNIFFGGPFGAALPQLTGSIVISGSNNIMVGGPRANTINQGTYGYVGGNANFITTIPLITTSSIVRPFLNANNINGQVNLAFTTSSLGAPGLSNNNIFNTVLINHQSSSLSFTNNIVGINLTSNANTTTLDTVPLISSNLIVGSAQTLNHNSSSIQYSQNVGAINVTNNYTSSVSAAVNNITVSQNFAGGSNQQLFVSGSNSGTRRAFNSNFLMGRTNIVNSFHSGSSFTGGHLVSTALIGQDLIVSASNQSTTNGGTVIVGRFNATGSLQESSQDTVFVVGTGVSAGTRRNALRIDNQNNSNFTGSVNITGSLNVQGGGNVTITGSLNQAGGPVTISGSNINVRGGSVTISGSQLNTNNYITYNGSPNDPGTMNNFVGHFMVNRNSFVFNNIVQSQLSSGSNFTITTDATSSYSTFNFSSTYGGTNANIGIANYNGNRVIDLNADTLNVSGTLKVGVSNNKGVIQLLGGSQWLYRDGDNNTVVGNANGVGSGFFAGSEKNMIFNGFSTPFATGSNNVLIQGGGDNFISGSGNVFIGNHNGHAGGSNNILLGATSYSSGSIFDSKFELGTVATSRIFHKQGTNPLQIGDDVEVTGSINISSVMNLTPQNPLPTGNIGDLAVSSSNQLYFYNGAWTLVV